MSLELAFLISVALALDSFAVSIASGVILRKTGKIQLFHGLKIAGFFGIFQSLMAFIGYLTGCFIKKWIEQWDHWVAFLILFFLGIKMIYEAKKIKKEETQTIISPLANKTLFLFSLATSIDALAVGISFSVLGTLDLSTVLIMIGVITFILCFIGVFVGERLGGLFEEKIEIVGGMALILIGTKILIEHIFFQ